MATEREKMIAGELYDALDPELVALRGRARDLCRELNAPAEFDQERRKAILVELFGEGGDSDVWVGAGALILPGVRVGSRTVIGAGSVVTRDLPSDVFAAGNPCRVIRAISS